MPATVHITSAANAETRWVIRDRVRFMGEVDGTGLAVVEVDVPPGSGTPPHRHESPEIFRILSGEITFGLFAEGPPQSVVAGPGTVVTVPRHLPHHYQNLGTGPATMLVVVERSMADFFREVGRVDTPPAGPPTPEEIAPLLAACARHGITLLPPPTPQPETTHALAPHRL